MNTQHGAVYVRVSTDDQTEYSPDAQISAIREYAKKNRIIISDEHIFVDEGISGRRAEKRPAFQEMIKLAKKKPKLFHVILVHKFDRFARNREDSVVYKSLLRKECGIKVISITEQLEDDKFSIILESMLEAMAEYYSLNLADEVKKGMTEKAKRGGYQTSPPFGYRMKSGKLVVHPEESKIVKLIFDKFIYENETFFTIAKLVNDMGIKTHRGNRFENRTIAYILQNPVYAGKVRWNPVEKTRTNYNHPNLIVANSSHQPIVDEAAFEAAAKKIMQHKKQYRRKSRPAQEYAHWLSGMIRCGTCGAILVHLNNGFQCRNYTGGKCSVSHYISVNKIENAIFKKIEHDMNSPNQLEFDIVAISDHANEIEILKKQLEKISSKHERAKQAFLAGIDSMEEYKKNKDMIQDEEVELREHIKEIESKKYKKDMNNILKNNLKNAYKILTSEASKDDKNNVIRSIIKQITFDKPNEVLLIDYFVNN
ncbi:recombinase family protein [Petroclostridium sp. X23]|uniref:recombinase family protein n=1 Tax=Petroclostridium sp. X23 TaxID=3045146 RepID=UPI0024ACA6EA|nr:recombinase family protein [Petroclostridium sp. X23]WHH59589.1 recombinase family protein [Petroclostridium sp. X23]